MHVKTMDWGRPGLEPRIEEMLHDPIVQLVMRRDRLTVAQIMATVARARARLQGARTVRTAGENPARSG